MIGSGNNAVDVQIYRGGMAFEVTEWEKMPEGVPVINEEARKEMQKVDGVENVTLYTSRNYADGIYYQNKLLQGAKIYGS